MTSLIRGQNVPLVARTFTVGVAGAAPGSVDVMVFQVDEDNRVRTDDDFVFFNNPASPEGAVRLTGADAVDVDLARVPAAIATLRIAVTLDDSVGGSLASISGLGVTVGDIDAPAAGLTTERSAVLAEVYRRGDAWKVRNVSAGWDGGFAALVTEHGVSVDDTSPPTPPSPPAPPPPPAPSAPPVNLAKITLTKAQPTVSLAKARDRASGTMRVNLNWSRETGGRFRKKSTGIDLDLGCLYEMADGSAGVIQAVGNHFGSREGHPWIFLDGDDRDGAVSEGENLLIDLAHVADFTRILVFAFIYEGAPNWSAADGVVTLYPPTGPEIEVRLDSADDRAITCAIALLQVHDGEMTVTREVRYIDGGQRLLDEAYGWGLTWTRGSK